MKSLPERIMEHAGGHADLPGRPASPRPKGRGGSGALPPGPFRPAHADLPRGLHAPDRDPLRAVCAEHREVTPGALGALGRDDRPERRRRGQLACRRPVRSSAGVQGRHLLVQGVARDPAVLGRHRHHLRHPRLRTGSGCRCRRRGAGQRRSVPALPNGSASGPARSSRKGLHAPGSWRGFVRRPSDST